MIRQNAGKAGGYSPTRPPAILAAYAENPDYKTLRRVEGFL
jgi:hypothetical protein